MCDFLFYECFEALAAWDFHFTVYELVTVGHTVLCLLLLVEVAASDDDNASGDHRGIGHQQSMADPKSWSDNESLSEIEVKNKVNISSVIY